MANIVQQSSQTNNRFVFLAKSKPIRQQTGYMTYAQRVFKTGVMRSGINQMSKSKLTYAPQSLHNRQPYYIGFLSV
jgi:uncharacterized protein YbcV (DUF1398 family)